MNTLSFIFIFTCDFAHEAHSDIALGAEVVAERVVIMELAIVVKQLVALPDVAPVDLC